MTDAAAVEVVSPGVLASLQDLGRHGYRRYGVPRSGALEPAWLRIANALAGAPGGAAAIEAFLLGPTLRANGGPVRIGLAGDVSAELERGGERRPIGSWRSVTLRPGDTLRVGPSRPARAAYVAVAGLEVEAVLGSASAFLRGGFAGLAGRPLRAGDVLRAAPPPAGPERALPQPPARPSGPFRAVPGPQDDRFAGDALANLLGEEWKVTNASDRMGARLDGPRLAHRTPSASEIVSDAIVPGAIQVPGSGQPIVLLADCQTIGGYAKIATVASADLPRLAVLPPGARLRFARATVEEAEAAARAREAEVRALLASIRPLPPDGA
jgi:allophanate hydrolase